MMRRTDATFLRPRSFVVDPFDNYASIGVDCYFGVGTIIGIAVSVAISAISYGIQAALAPTLKKPLQSSRIDNLRSIQKDNTAPLRVIYGTYRTSGVLLFARSVTFEGERKRGGPYLHAALALAHGPIADIYDIQLNDEPANSTRFARLAAMVPFMGAPDQPMMRGPIRLGSIECQLPVEWLRAYRPLHSIAYLWMLLKHDISVFPGGAPNVRATMDGRLLYDPREDVDLGGAQTLEDPTSWRFSRNWALCVRDLLVSRDYGIGVADADICEDCVIAAANISDETISAVSDKVNPDDPNETPPTMAKYEVGFLFETDEQPIDVLSKLLIAGAGAALFYGGQWHIKAGAAESVAVDVTTGAEIVLTPDDLRDDADLTFLRLPGRDERINTVRGSFINPAKQYLSDNFPPVTREDFVETDGNIEISTTLQLDATQHVDRARYIASILLRQARMGQLIWPGKPTLTQIVPMSVVRAVHPHMGWGYWGPVTVTGSTKTYAATNIGLGLTVGEVIPIQGCAISGNNGSKTVASIVSDDEITVTQTCTDEAPGPNVTVGGKRFLVRQRERDERGAIDLTLEEYTDDNYIQDLKAARLPDPTNLPDPFDLFPPTNVEMVESVHVNPDGTRVAKIVVTWAEPTDGLVEGYTLFWRLQDGVQPLQSRYIPSPATRAEINNLPQGDYYVAIASTLNTKLSTAVVRFVSVTYRSTPPPDPIDVRVEQAAGGARRLTWRYAVPRPPDLFGVEVRWSEGSIGSATDNDWDDARVILQTPADSVEVTTPTAPGTYTYLLKSVDTDGYYSTGIGSVVVTLTASGPDVLAERAFNEEGWPVNLGGHLAGGVVNTDGHLEGASSVTWDAATDPFSSFGTWNRGGGELVYVSPIIDLGGDLVFLTQAREQTRNADTVTIDIRHRREADGLFGGWHAPLGGVGRYVQARIIAKATTAAPIIEAFSLSVRGAFRDHLVNDVVMSGTSGTIRRIERYAGQWQSGPWQYGVCPRPDSTTGFAALELEPESALDFNGSTTWVQTIDHTTLRLQGGPFGVELAFRADALTGTQILVTKGTDWRVRLNGAALEFSVGGTLLSTVTLPDAVPIYHVSYFYDSGVLTTYLNGAVAATNLTGTIAMPGSTATVRFGTNETATGDWFNGALQNCRLWSVPRTPADITRDTAAHIDPRTPGLVAYWRFDDASGTTVREHVGVLSANGTVTGGGGTWVRIGFRESPALPLTLLPQWRSGSVQRVGTAPAGTSATVEISVNDGTSWQSIGTDKTPIAGLAVGASTAGLTLRCRQALRTTTLANTPTVTAIHVELTYDRAVGDLIVQPGVAFSEVTQASITALQHASAAPAWVLVAKDATAARFRVYTTATAAPLDLTADVAFRGVPMAA